MVSRNLQLIYRFLPSDQQQVDGRRNAGWEPRLDCLLGAPSGSAPHNHPLTGSGPRFNQLAAQSFESKKCDFLSSARGIRHNGATEENKNGLR
jgi:hypothetical protein